MKIWLITDTHFGHEKLLEYGRPDNFSQRILMAWGSMIASDDVVIHLGDICIGNDEQWHRLLKGLPARKWLCRGNHDQKSNSWYLTHGWDVVCDYFSLKMFGKNILFSHKPMAWDGYYDVNVHGHFHDSDHRRLDPEFNGILNGFHKLLAIERTDYKPVLLRSFIWPNDNKN